MRITLSRKTRQYLEEEMHSARQKGQLRFAMRLEAILLLHWKLGLEQVALLSQRTVRTLYEWVKLFLLKGIQGLRPKKQSGKISRLNAFHKRRLQAMILAGPESEGYSTGVWTSALIQDLIFQRFGVEYAVAYIPQLLRGMGMSCTKVQTQDKRTNKEAQRKWEEEQFPALVTQAITEEAAILYEDESIFRHWSRPAYSWGQKGTPIISQVKMGSTAQQIFGAINLLTGKLTYRHSKKKNADGDEFLAFLRYLVYTYGNQKLYLVIDNGSIHQGPQIESFLAKHQDKIELVRLPSYSPKFNPIEKLWKKLKQQHLNNRYFENKKAFLKALEKGLRSLQDAPETILTLMKKWRNLYFKIEAGMNTGVGGGALAEKKAS